ncbi:hypothetical protein GCM10010501_74270 [Streptomyces libani subsp. rufus]|nr:hypothetical protein GCM10010501_74270 [Streptomyces libani subsp. rufus]
MGGAVAEVDKGGAVGFLVGPTTPDKGAGFDPCSPDSSGSSWGRVLRPLSTGRRADHTKTTP